MATLRQATSVYLWKALETTLATELNEQNQIN